MSCPFAAQAAAGAKCPFSGASMPSSSSSSSSSTPIQSSPYTHPVNPYADAAPLTKEQIALVKATAPVMAEHGVTITTHFYKRMFGKCPSLNNVFNRANQATGEQPRALAAAVHAYAANIDNLGALGDAVNKIAQKHCSLNITADQYTIVGEHLIASVAEVLGAALTPETAQAWIAAYAQLANILIGAEAKLYKEAAATRGGWNGWRKFTVQQKVVESSEITSFYLRPSDSLPLPTCQPGQYISIKLFCPSLGYDQPRQYSLTHLAATPTSPECYRISVKREQEHASTPAGLVSNLMHDTVKCGDELDVSHPMGEFTLDITSSTPVVLVSAGVGVTPMISMLQQLIQSQSPQARRVMFIHGTRSRDTHAMRAYINDAVKTHRNISKHIFYQHIDTPTPARDMCACGEHSYSIDTACDHDHVGRLNLHTLQHTLAPVLDTAHFYVCGSRSFMTQQRQVIEAMGVPAARVHTELFGTGANP